MRKLLSNTMNDGALSATELIATPGETFTKENSKSWQVKKDGPVMPVSKVLIMAQFITGTIQSEYQPLNILMIGLGGSTVNNFFSQFATKPNITVIELDGIMEDISKKWFGLEETINHRIYIADGAKYLINRPDNSQKFDAIIIDACYNDPTSELICPVEVFRSVDIASHVKRNLAPMGTLSMNSISFSNQTDGFQKVGR
uniref:PABS domain-containing protein n=1 Tax=Acrobeloides nanus TaxID=290746 RepID=A0A914D2G4_9BILA